jgi:hypothetical protein
MELADEKMDEGIEKVRKIFTDLSSIISYQLSGNFLPYSITMG